VQAVVPSDAIAQAPHLRVEARVNACSALQLRCIATLCYCAKLYTYSHCARPIHRCAITGNVVLENMRLKPSLLDSLLLPVALKHGLIGRLELRIPWSQLGTEPIVVVLDRVFVVIEPKYQWDEAGKEASAQAIKRSKVIVILQSIYYTKSVNSMQDYAQALYFTSIQSLLRQQDSCVLMC
jgi:N-terminal region of Chorein or VPS13